MERIILEEIERAKQDKLIIVEGMKDAQALEELGFEEENIFVLKNGKCIKENIEKIIRILKQNKKTCIILTDFDSEGKKLYEILKKELGNNGLKIDNSLRLAILKEKISHVEGLDSWIKHKERITILKK